MTTNSLSIQPRTRKESPGTISVGPHSSDTQIVDHFQRGDSTAFDFLYLRYRSTEWLTKAIEIPDRIYGVICSMVSNREDALDITQDIFLKAYQALENFKRTSQFYSWLYRIAINCCIDYMRRQSKHAWFSDKPVSDEVFYHQEAARHLSSPSNAVDYEEFCLYLHRAVVQLTPKQREVFYSALQRGTPVKGDCPENGTLHWHDQGTSLSDASQLTGVASPVSAG